MGLIYVGIGIGVGLTIVGVGLGIGRIGGSACDGISRQPEAAGIVQTAMIISAALIEGVALFALVIMFLGASVTNEKIAAEKEETVETFIEEEIESE